MVAVVGYCSIVVLVVGVTVVLNYGICGCCRSVIVKCMLCCGARGIYGVLVVVVVMVGYWRIW